MADITASVRRRRGIRAALLAALLLGACTPPARPPVHGLVLPTYVFPLGATKEDVLGMLGHPPTGPRFDRYSHLTEIVYRFPFPAIQAETRLPDGTTRVEMADTVHFFFNRKNLLERMALRPNPYYPSFAEHPVHKVTVLPRLVDTEGRLRPLSDLPPPAPPPAPPAPPPSLDR